MKIAICVIAYNRTDSLKRLLDSLERADYGNDKIPLIISIDKSNTDVVEKFANSYRWPHGTKRVITHPENLGLRKHILSCGKLLDEYEALIVLEDDIYVAPGFYAYATESVSKYYDNPDVAGISLYSFAYYTGASTPFHPIKTDSDVYLMQVAQSWGQIWMRPQWRDFMEWYNDNSGDFGPMDHLPEDICNWPKSSWLKYHTRYCIESGKFFVYPYDALSTCFAETGTHTGSASTLQQSFMLFCGKKDYKFNPAIRYDGFREFIGFGNTLNIPEEELCVDFYGLKKNRLNQRYWLTRTRQPFKIVKSFALQLRPYELNVIYGISGQELFLYDTSAYSSEPSTLPDHLFDEYMDFRRSDVKFVVLKSIKSFIKKLIGRK